MKKIKYQIFILFVLIICTVARSQTKVYTDSLATLQGWLAFKEYSKKEKPRQIYLLKGSDTLKVLNDNGDYPEAGIINVLYWRAFKYDSVKLSDDFSLYVKKRSHEEKGDVLLYSMHKTKKIIVLTETPTGYSCALLPSYWRQITTKYVPKYNVHYAKADTLKAKLLFGEMRNKPLTNNKVYLTSASGDTLKTTETNAMGDFEFIHEGMENSSILVGNNDKIKNEKEIYLANQKGIVISAMRKTGNGFAYRILKADIVKLKAIESGEISMTMDPFANSDAKTVTVTENILYPNNEYKISSDISAILDGVVLNLAKNTTYKLEIYSHTDARGNDAANLELSNKRAKAVMEYLVSKGIDKSRLTAKGMGETKIINQCKNGVNCSEKDHEANRRTEFKYLK